jgi:thiaminase/transcriptional activator TenA
MHGRIALALTHAAFDSQTKQHVIAYGSSIQGNLVAHDYVQDLIDENATAWSELTDHPFPRSMAKGVTALNGFRHYMIQDGTYLEYYYRVRMESVGKTGTFEEIKELSEKLYSSLTYVATFRDDLTKKLGVPSDVVTNEAKSEELQNSIRLYEGVVKDGDWLDIHIVLTPCIVGYNIIANELLREPETIRNTLFYPLWIQANAAGSSAKKYWEFINNNIANLSQEERDRRWQGWVTKFGTACGTEAAFFGLAIPNKFSAYNIVKDGTYNIRSYRAGNAYLTSSQPILVVTQEDPPQDEREWSLTNSASGFVIKNVTQQGFLTVSVEDPLQPKYDVSISAEEHRWSINPVEVHGLNGTYLVYQLFSAVRSQYVLDAGNDATNPKVFVANNAEISSQLWVLELVAAV